MKHFLKLICALLTLSLVLSLSALAQEEKHVFKISPDTIMVRIATPGDQTNIRSGPGLGYEVIGTLKNDELPYLNKSQEDSRGVTWYQVDYNGRDGWVSQKYVVLISAGETIVRTRATAEVSYQCVTLDQGVASANVRRGPGLGYETVGRLTPGGSLEYLDEDRADDRGVTWYKVRINGAEGWVSSALTSLSTGGTAGRTSSGGQSGSGSSKSGPFGKGVHLYNYLDNPGRPEDSNVCYKVGFFDESGKVHDSYELMSFYYGGILYSDLSADAELWKVSDTLYFAESVFQFSGSEKAYMLLELNGDSLRLIARLEEMNNTEGGTELVDSLTGRAVYRRETYYGHSYNDEKDEALNDYFADYGLMFGRNGVELPDSQRVEKIDDYEKARNYHE